MTVFEQHYTVWLEGQIAAEKNPRRRELLEKGLGHGTVEFLRTIWYPTVKNFDFLFPEWEVRDFHNGYRYVDLAYMPGGMKGGIEIQGYGPHARDLDVRRFKDLCWRHCLLALDGWLFLPVAYPSILEEPERCRQLVLAFIGRFISPDAPGQLAALETETLRYARRVMRPFPASELAAHLRVTERYARQVLQHLMVMGFAQITNNQQRYRLYGLTEISDAYSRNLRVSEK
ncbi:MAG: hypothetical protein K0Q90_661 [Paenibacillaceae bacterium]|jgi:hypothetical protein|nr:hypothetical protein [Paenibacillaceae bacterium]